MREVTGYQLWQLSELSSGFPSHFREGQHPRCPSAGTTRPCRSGPAARPTSPPGSLPFRSAAAMLAWPHRDPRPRRPVRSSEPLQPLFPLPGMLVPQLSTTMSLTLTSCLPCAKDSYKQFININFMNHFLTSEVMALMILSP